MAKTGIQEWGATIALSATSHINTIARRATGRDINIVDGQLGHLELAEAAGQAARGWQALASLMIRTLE